MCIKFKTVVVDHLEVDLTLYDTDQLRVIMFCLQRHAFRVSLVYENKYKVLLYDAPFGENTKNVPQL